MALLEDGRVTRGVGHRDVSTLAERSAALGLTQVEERNDTHADYDRDHRANQESIAHASGHIGEHRTDVHHFRAPGFPLSGAWNEIDLDHGRRIRSDATAQLMRPSAALNRSAASITARYRRWRATRVRRRGP